MAEFVRAQIFGTTFEITSRYEQSSARAVAVARRHADQCGQIHGLTTGGHGSIWSGVVREQAYVTNSAGCFHADRWCLWTGSSAKDQLTGQAVAVKKIMKPFSTPVLSKRTYRELKLIKHLRHENVCPPCTVDAASTDLADGACRSSA